MDDKNVDKIRAEARAAYERPEDSVWVKDVFADSVVVEAEGAGKTYSVGYSMHEGEVTFGELEQVEKSWVEKQRARGWELTGPIAWKQEEERLAFGAVLVPGEPDSDGDVLTASKIAQVAHAWLADYGNIDLQHSLNNAALPVESFILPAAMSVKMGGKDAELPAGTWILGSRIDDDDLWAKVKSGELSGYSIMGVRRAALKSTEAPAYKRTMLADLGPDWVAPFVSLVDEPAVPKAKFYAIKSAEKSEPEKPGIFAHLKNLIHQQQERAAMTDEEIKRAIKAAVKEELAELEIEVEEDIEESASVEKAEQVEEAEVIEEADEEDEEVEEVVEKSDELAEENESLKAKVKELEKKLSGRSRSLKSADEQSETSTQQSDRDAFGRKIRS